MTIPNTFSETIIRIRGETGRTWLNSLPETIGLCEVHWNLKVLEPFDLSYNYVARTEGDRVVVKVCLPGPDFKAELDSLKLYDGRGLCRLVDYIEDKNVLLLESLQPGVNIKILEEHESIQAICSVIQEMQAANRNLYGTFPTVFDWAKGLEKMRVHFAKRLSPFDDKIVKKVEALFPKLISTQRKMYVLHGDLHHENILAYGKGWKAIDPKGVVGDVEYELIPFLLNNHSGSSINEVIDARIHQFHQLLNVDIQRVYGWGLCHSLMSAWWNIEDNLAVSELDLRFIKHFDKRTESMIA
jgi:streptomycin 6-kinase